jgi:predicted aspartyl protease
MKLGFAALLAACLAFAAPVAEASVAPSGCAPAPANEAGEAPPHALRLNDDGVGRAVAPVYVNGAGPFRFIVDTGANRSVLSGALAARLGVSAYGVGEVHSIDSIRIAPMARVRSLSVGALQLNDVETPLLDGDVLAGQHGFLGVDGLGQRRLLIVFDHRCVEITEPGAAPLPDWIVMPGRLQFGSSFVMQGRIAEASVTILVDTGSNISLGNSALREALRPMRARTIERHGAFIFTVGRPIVLEQAIWTPRVWIGREWIGNVEANIGDYHIFDLWGLNDAPALLIGMDVLAQAGALAIDYSTQTIYFRDRPRGRWH